MKKIVRNVLLLALGLSTSMSFAQDWSGNSRTRIEGNNLSEEEKTMSTSTRNRIGVAWSGEGWSMNASGNHNYTMGDGISAASIYEASFSTDLPLGLNLTGGRMALHYGDGRIIGNDDWGNYGQTHDGFVVGYDGFAKIDFGIDGQDNSDWAYLYLSKGGENWNIDGAYLDENGVITLGGALDYSMLESKLGLGVDYWMQGEEDAGLTAVTLSYKVSDKLNVGFGMDMYTIGWNTAGWGDEHQFNGAMDNHGMSGDWSDMNFGLGYAMGDWDAGADYHMMSSDNRNVSELDLSLNNKLNDNVSYGMGYSMLSGDSEDSWAYLQISVNP